LPRGADLDAVLLEDRTPLVVKGMEIKPVATNRFKKTDNVIMYSEIYEPASGRRKSAESSVRLQPPRPCDQSANHEHGERPRPKSFIHKGSPVVPVGLRVTVKRPETRTISTGADGNRRRGPPSDEPHRRTLT